MNWLQLKLIFLLRWQLTRNQWTRSRGARLIVAILIAVAACLLGAIFFVGSLFGAAYGLREASPEVVMIVWLIFTCVFLFSWLIGLLSELQRSETIDLQRLMHLPAALGQIFIFNYLASHLALSIVIAVPALFGLTIGLVVARGAMMWFLLPLALSMIFMVTAWTYFLRGWLAAMMTNPRRRRAIIMGITLAFILLAQGPNLYFNVLRDGKSSAHKTPDRETINKVLAAQQFIPPLWVAVGARRLAEGNAVPALLGALGCFALGALGLHRAYRSTMKFYYGESGGKAPAQINASAATELQPPEKSSARFLELTLPGVPEEASALALASLRSMLRAPEVKIAWGSSFLVTLILGGSMLFRAAPKMPETTKPFVIPAITAFSLMMLVQFLANQFGFDRDGFRALVLSPANRRMILLGKNLAALPVMVCSGVLLAVLVAVFLRLPPFEFLAALFQTASMWIIAGLCGTLLSILMPYRIQSGSMKPTKMPGLKIVLIGLFQLSLPVFMLPAFVPPLAGALWRAAGMPTAVPINLLLSIGLLTLLIFVYWQLLPPLARLLQRRETKILEVVTAEVE